MWEQHSRQREQRGERHRRQKEHGWSGPDPGMWVGEGEEATQEQVGQIMPNTVGRRERSWECWPGSRKRSIPQGAGMHCKEAEWYMGQEGTGSPLAGFFFLNLSL